MSEETELTDELLMGRIAAGQTESVGRLIQRHGGVLLGFLRRMTRSMVDAEDISQEVWLRVIRSAHSYDPTRRFSAWLFKIAWNRVRDHWQRIATQQARHVTTASDALDAVRSADRRPDEALLESERVDRLRQIIDQLPARLAEALCLRYFEELSEHEMAARLGIPVGTVKSRLHNGIKQLSPLVKGDL